MAEMNDTPETEADGGQMSLIGHLTELRHRLGVALLALPIILLYEISVFGAKIIAPKDEDTA